MRTLSLCAILLLAACRADETLHAFAAADAIWILQEIDGKPFGARATLTLPEPGQIVGMAPCNSYTTTLSVPYPWFEVGPILSTKRACPDLDAETAFFTALADMSLVETLGNTLILSTPEGRQMIFKSAD